MSRPSGSVPNQLVRVGGPLVLKRLSNVGLVAWKRLGNVEARSKTMTTTRMSTAAQFWENRRIASLSGVRTRTCSLSRAWSASTIAEDCVKVSVVYSRERDGALGGCWVRLSADSLMD